MEILQFGSVRWSASTVEALVDGGGVAVLVVLGDPVVDPGLQLGTYCICAGAAVEDGLDIGKATLPERINWPYRIYPQSMKPSDAGASSAHKIRGYNAW
nr:hypothetical protein [uncultured Albidiferax sp.]